jgi:hypothetical protein
MPKRYDAQIQNRSGSPGGAIGPQSPGKTARASSRGAAAADDRSRKAVSSSARKGKGDSEKTFAGYNFVNIPFDDDQSSFVSYACPWQRLREERA